MNCHRCGAPDLELDLAYSAWRRVTSDCKPWSAGGRLARCRRCRLVQAPVTPEWQAEAAAIYGQYTIYHQSGGAEQSVFGGDAQGQARSDALVTALAQHGGLAETGRLLDVGCGNGAFLRAWHRSGRRWTLHGLEVSDQNRAQVEAIPGVAALHVGDLPGVPGEFDLISLVHVLEHIPSPQTFLADLRPKLRPGGQVLVQVPDCEQNPFMLLVADHCSHFSVEGLAGVVRAAGFDVLHATNRWIAKEVSVVARRADRPAAPTATALSAAESDAIFGGGRWLAEVLSRVEAARRTRPFGVFGTSIAATWLQAQTDGAAGFFVDEDPHRVGREHLGRPILAPAQAPAGSTVFVALPQPLAGRVAARVARPDLRIVLPPDVPGRCGE